jgi:hypothetical protein
VEWPLSSIRGIILATTVRSLLLSETKSLIPLLDVYPISRVRRNHALEHATITILSEQYKHLRVVARSSLWGFYIYGDVPTDRVVAAVEEGLRRLKAGQRHMAIHPTCGTNLVIAGVLAGTGAFLALGVLSKKKPEGFFKLLARLPLAWTAAVAGILLAQPLGPLLQAHVTTWADVGDLCIIDVTRETRAGVVVHHVRTGGGR